MSRDPSPGRPAASHPLAHWAPDPGATASERAERQRRWIGLGVVLGLHAAVAWVLLQSGVRVPLLRTEPVKVSILDAPAPPPPPKIVSAPPPPAPPPPRAAPVPPPPAPELARPVPPVQSPLAEPVRPPEPAPPAPPAPVAPPAPAPAPPAPVAAPAAPAAPARAPAPPAAPSVEVVCPGYRELLNSALAGQWERVGITGVVRVLITIRDNQITDVQPQSGPSEYYRVVQRAVRRMRCQVQGSQELHVPLEISFRES